DEIEPDSQSSAFNVAFEGQTDTAESVAGSIFLENVATRADAAKFKVTGGEVVVGDSFPYDVVFGKARVVETPANDVLTIIAQLVDENGDVSTAKLVMDSANLKDEILSGSAGFDIVSSKVPGFDIASGSGTVSPVST
nr:hypothetical protein [Nitrosopumilaceae archaeon]NIU00140.1 hypothetical protein [Nitrosopumilaceae archaeon]NIU86541.1 hypothetical protein [Nitrosopumilaceae archaeon]NIV65253.1 hypothetical protein [Nitrosopumilaceae archaeon]NIX60742.1 hypothetical protein [Nitrosopumilaceae archaeon]